MSLEKFVLDSFGFIAAIDFSIFSTLLGMVVILFWLVMIGWVWVDSGDRTSKDGIRVVYLLLVIIFNIPGLIIYLIIRPSETIEEIYWADLERRYLKYETSELGDCSKCGHQLYPGYVFCTNCGNEIKKKCPRCGVVINKDHKYCEYCGLQVRERAVIEEQYPNVEVMKQQILATKEQATETVESKRTRYKTGKSFVVKLGDVILGGLEIFKKRFNEYKGSLKKVEERKEESTLLKVKKQNKQKQLPKRKKKKKKKKR